MHLFTLFVAMLPAATRLAPQDSTPLAAGERVRVTAPAMSPTPIVGAFARLGADTLVIETPVSTRRFPRASVTRLEVSTGRRSHVGQGALYGGIVGAGVAALALGSSSLCADLEAGGTCALVGAAGGGVAGVLLGALIGSATKSDRWEEVAPTRLRVTLTRRDNRPLLLVASIAF